MQTFSLLNRSLLSLKMMACVLCDGTYHNFLDGTMMAPKPQTHPSFSARPESEATAKMNSSNSQHNANTNNVNLPTAYLLYFLGGVFGLHHAYLNRPNQAIAWYATSGLFGFGLLRDLIRIPYYVSLCRDDRINDTAARVRSATVVAREGIPPMSLCRMVLMVGFGTYFGFMASCLVALPKKEEGVINDEKLWWTGVVYGILRAVGSAVGIWLVGNMGEEMIQTKTAQKEKNKEKEGGDIIHDDVNQKGEILGLATWCIASLWILKSSILGGIVCATRRRRYRSTMNPGYSSSATKRILWHLLKCSIFTAIMTLAVCNHGSIVVNGNRVYLQDAIKNAIHSGFWKEFNWEQYREQQQSRRGSDYLKTAFDITGERAARRTLGVSRDVTHVEVRKAYKKLALKYHPDKIGSNVTDKEIEEAKRQFNKVQEAYDVLNSIEQARKKRDREEAGETSGSGSSNYSRGESYPRDEM